MFEANSKLSDLAYPQTQLTKKDTKFEWTEIHENAFNVLKNSININATGYFDKNLKTEVIVYASPIGLGAVLVQYDPNDRKKKNVVLYVSRALTQTECKYSQIEREGLVVVWAYYTYA